MGQYDPLRRFLSRRKQTPVDPSFVEIERITGAMPPRRAESAQWWTASAPAHIPHIQAASRRAAGFGTALVGEERVRFERASDRVH